MMTAEDVVKVVEGLESEGIAVWLDGGWGVDALVGEQTREHDDLDIAIDLDHAAEARAALEALGFQQSLDQLPTRFVVEDDGGRSVDIHTFIFDGEGKGTQILQDGSRYVCPNTGFTGFGLVAGRKMRCFTAEAQMRAHLGYEPDEKDLHNVRLLNERLGVSLPEAYREWLGD